MTLLNFVVNVGGGKVARKKLGGRVHLVVPAASIAEGVWSGNLGPLYYSAAVLERSTPGWNHKPILVNHPPPDAQGRAVLAGDNPDIVDQTGIGLLLKSWYDTKVRHEAWIDEERANSIDKRIVTNLDAGKSFETSNGYTPVINETKGKWHDAEYHGEVLDIQADHLAVLPDRLGAYSVADGGGLNVINESCPEWLRKMIGRASEFALARSGLLFVKNELSMNDIGRQVAQLLKNKYGQPGEYWDGYPCEVYSDYVIFNDGSGRFYRQDFAVGKGDRVKLDGDAQPVDRVVQFVPAKTPAANEAVNPPEEVPVAFDKKAHVDALISGGQYGEEDRLWLSQVEEAQLQSNDKFKIKPASAPAPTVTPAANAAPQGVLPNGHVAIPQETYNVLVNEHNTQAAELIAKIIAAPGNVFTADQLKGMSVVNLRGIAAVIPASQPQPAVPGSVPFLPIPPMFPQQPAMNFAGNIGGPPPAPQNAAAQPGLDLPDTWGPVERK